MLVQTNTGAIVGVDGLVVQVEVDASGGLQSFRMVGLPDAAVREARVRVQAALANSGFGSHPGEVTVNLAPAGVRKQGTAFDLAVALGLVAAMGQAPAEDLRGSLCLGELALDGTLRSVRGVLPVVSEAVRAGIVRFVVPRENASEAALVARASVYAVGSLREAVDVVSGGWGAPEPVTDAPTDVTAPDGSDLSEVKGQHQGKRALEICAAGGHNLLLVGPPGGGKSFLAARLPSLMPRPSFEHALEITRIYSSAGLLDQGGFVSSPPFRAPHHTISSAAIVGGGAGPTPGEASLAHRGVLFLDELAEFPRPALESLRQPLEEGRVRIRRVDRMVTLPARFTLVAAMNPCPCGFSGTETRPCACTDAMIHRYRAKISGPMLDRIDLRVSMRALGADELIGGSSGERSEQVRARVLRAREIQRARFRGGRARLNAFLSPGQLARYCTLDREGEDVLRHAVDKLNLSARGFDRVRRVARTVADLDGAARIGTEHLHEAIAYRSGDGTLP